MKIITILLLILFSLGCGEKKIENGLNLKQLEHRVNQSERKYLKEMQYIFSNYDLILYDFQSIRTSNFFYFVERTGFFNIEDYRGG